MLASVVVLYGVSSIFPFKFSASGWATGWPDITESRVWVQQNSWACSQLQWGEERSLKMGKIFPFCKVGITTNFWFAQLLFPPTILILSCAEIQIEKSWKFSWELGHFSNMMAIVFQRLVSPLKGSFLVIPSQVKATVTGRISQLQGNTKPLKPAMHGGCFPECGTGILLRKEPHSCRFSCSLCYLQLRNTPTKDLTGLGVFLNPCIMTDTLISAFL